MIRNLADCVGSVLDVARGCSRWSSDSAYYWVNYLYFILNLSFDLTYNFLGSDVQLSER